MSVFYVPEKDEVIIPWDVRLAKATKEDYERDARWFLEFGHFVDPKKVHHRPGPDFAAKQTSEEVRSGMKRMILAFKEDPALAKRMVYAFIVAYNKKIESKEIGTTETRHRLRPVILACDMNDILVPWKKMMRLIQSGKTTKEDREYTLEEVRKLLAKAGINLRVAMLFMCGSGIRVGAFDYLTLRDVRPVYRLDRQVVVPDPKDLVFDKVTGLYEVPAGGKLLCGVMTVYSDEEDADYDTLITREAFTEWNKYIGARRDSGERLTGDSAAIVTRRRFDSKDARSVRPMKSRSIANAINDLLWLTKIRTEKKKRHEVQMAHGMRKRFDNVANDHIDKPYVEKLIGWNAGTAKHYDRHIPKPAVEQYLSAMPFLSIEEAYRKEAALAERLEEVEKTKDEEIKSVRVDMALMREENKQLRTQVQELLRSGGVMSPEKLKEMVRELVLDTSKVSHADRPPDLGEKSADETLRAVRRSHVRKA